MPITKLFTEDNAEIPVRKTKRPSLRDAGGNIWETSSVIIDGKEVKVWLEVNYGRYLYFEDENNDWRKFPMHDYVGDGLDSFNIEPFTNPPQKLWSNNTNNN